MTLDGETLGGVGAAGAVIGYAAVNGLEGVPAGAAVAVAAVVALDVLAAPVGRVARRVGAALVRLEERIP